MMSVENVGKALVFLAGLEQAVDVTHLEIL
jgi:hypothetical protein